MSEKEQYGISRCVPCEVRVDTADLAPKHRYNLLEITSSVPRRVIPVDIFGNLYNVLVLLVSRNHYSGDSQEYADKGSTCGLRPWWPGLRPLGSEVWVTLLASSLTQGMAEKSANLELSLRKGWCSFVAFRPLALAGLQFVPLIVLCQFPQERDQTESCKSWTWNLL